MKILSIEQVRQADAYTLKNEPIKDIDLMERAATVCFNWIKNKINKKQKIQVFCGLGNNAGDGLATSRLLSNKGFNVEVYIIRYSNKISQSCKTNYERLLKTHQVKVHNIKEGDKLPDIDRENIVIDAIFGSGLSRAIKGFIADVIDNINKSNAIVISIDVPSGLFCDKSNKDNPGAIINADYTLTFQFPKFAFLFAENDKYAGRWQVFSIGLHPDFIKEVKVKNFLIESSDCKKMLKKRNKFAHKGNFGHALLISGSYGKMGASVLASRACLRTGVGLLTTHIPKSGYNILQTAVPEAMVDIDASEKYFTEVPKLLSYNAIGIGPGIGKEEQTQKALKLLIQNTTVPIVFDADAINILGENKTWISFLPNNSILTPHPKEFERITNKATNDFERNEMQREFSMRYGVYVVLKGAHTAVTCPDGNCYFNTTGNPGMATAGSGDVLTGIILSLLAQKYTPKEACILGVYLHGLAGDIAAKEKGFESLLSGDIVNNIGKAFYELWNKK